MNSDTCCTEGQMSKAVSEVILIKKRLEVLNDNLAKLKTKLSPYLREDYPKENCMCDEKEQPCSKFIQELCDIKSRINLKIDSVDNILKRLDL